MSKFEESGRRVGPWLIDLMASAAAAGCYMELCPARTDCDHEACRSDRVTISYPASLDGDPIFGRLRRRRSDLLGLARAADKGATLWL